MNTDPFHRAPSSSSTLAGRSDEGLATTALSPSWTRTSWATLSMRTYSACCPSWYRNSSASPGPASLTVSQNLIINADNVLINERTFIMKLVRSFAFNFKFVYSKANGRFLKATRDTKNNTQNNIKYLI